MGRAWRLGRRKKFIQAVYRFPVLYHLHYRRLGVRPIRKFLGFILSIPLLLAWVNTISQLIRLIHHPLGKQQRLHYCDGMDWRHWITEDPCGCRCWANLSLRSGRLALDLPKWKARLDWPCLACHCPVGLRDPCNSLAVAVCRPCMY